MRSLLVFSLVLAACGVETTVQEVGQRRDPLGAPVNLGVRGAVSTDTRFIDSDPREWTEAGGRVFFAATDPRHGRELWVTDGTSAGTQMVRDIASGSSLSLAVPMAVLGNRVIFAADDSAHGLEPWVSDGTAEGTVLLADTRGGALPGVGTQEFVAHRGLVYFPTFNGLWSTDGTPSGTRLVLPGSFTQLTSSGDHLFFVRSGRLWRLGGADGGTMLYEACQSTSCSVIVGSKVDVNGTLFFTTTPSSSGASDSTIDIWTTDGSVGGTQLVAAPLTSSSSSTSVISMTKFQNRAFWITSSGLSPSGGVMLWASDGTDAGTGMVKMLTPIGSASSVVLDRLVVGPSRLFFYASDVNAGPELWWSDGTELGTEVMVDLRPGSLGSRGNGQVAPLGSGVVFNANDGTNGPELWVSNSFGSASMVDQGQGSLSPSSMFSTGTKVFFEGAQTLINGREPWVTDGTDAGTFMLRDIGRQQPVTALDGSVVTDDLLVFHAGGIVYRSNGSSIAPIGPATALSMVRQGNIVFGATDNAVVRTDGSDAGLKTVWVGPARPKLMVATPNQLYLVLGSDLYVHPSVDGGSRLVATGLPSSATSAVALGDSVVIGANANGVWLGDSTSLRQLDVTPAGSVVAAGSRVFYSAATADAGLELGCTDGLDAGLCADVFPGPLSGAPDQLTDVAGTLFFAATTTTGERELFSFGPAGLQLAANLFDGGSSNPSKLSVWGNSLLFVADNGAGRQLYLRNADGGLTGLPGPAIGLQSTPLFPPTTGPAVFAAGSAVGEELWETDGTPSGTRMAFEAAPGGQSSSPRVLGSTRTHVFFVANDGAGEALFAAPISGGGSAGGGSAGGNAGGSSAGGLATGGGAVAGGSAGGSSAGGSSAGGSSAGGSSAGGLATGGGAVAGGSAGGSSAGGSSAGGLATGGGAAAGGSAGGSSAGGSSAGGLATGGGAVAGGSSAGGSSAGGTSAGGSATAGGGSTGGSTAGGAAMAGGGAGGGTTTQPGGCSCSIVDPWWATTFVLAAMLRRRRQSSSRVSVR